LLTVWAKTVGFADRRKCCSFSPFPQLPVANQRRAARVGVLLHEAADTCLSKDLTHNGDAIRANLAKRKIEAVIPGRSNRRVKIEHDRALYKQRNRIERMFGQLKINRAIATRYDQLANSFLGMVHLATARYWLKFVHAA
jgi:transposase